MKLTHPDDAMAAATAVRAREALGIGRRFRAATRR
jgi:hypothetical protein